MEIKEEGFLKATAHSRPYLVRDIYRLHYGSTRVRRVPEYNRNYGPFKQRSGSRWTRRLGSRDSRKIVYSTILLLSLLILYYCFRQRSIVYKCLIDSYMPDLTD